MSKKPSAKQSDSPSMTSLDLPKIVGFETLAPSGICHEWRVVPLYERMVLVRLGTQGVGVHFTLLERGEPVGVPDVEAHVHDVAVRGLQRIFKDAEERRQDDFVADEVADLNFRGGTPR